MVFHRVDCVFQEVSFRILHQLHKVRNFKRDISMKCNIEQTMLHSCMAMADMRVRK